MICLELKADFEFVKTTVGSILYPLRIRNLTGLFHLICFIGYLKTAIKNKKENDSCKGKVISNQGDVFYYPTRCNVEQSIFYFTAVSLYMFRAYFTPIIRSTRNCSHSH
jgi:hypothetical protein